MPTLTTTPHEREAPRTGGGEAPLSYLEPKQFVVDKSIPVPRAQLGPRASAALWVLRIFVLVVSAMVIYTFVAQL